MNYCRLWHKQEHWRWITGKSIPCTGLVPRAWEHSLSIVDGSLRTSLTGSNQMIWILILDCLKSYSQTMFVSRMRQGMTMMQQGSSLCTQRDIDWLLCYGEFSGQWHRHWSIWVRFWIEAGTTLLSVKNLVKSNVNCSSLLIQPSPS